ncbi:MAG: hypothetical protein RR262_17780 [Clostridium sp.]
MDALFLATNAKSSPHPDSNLIGVDAAKADHELTLEDMLTYALQDEYVAISKYSLVVEKFGKQPPFTNIIIAENNHINHLKPLFISYIVPLPVDNSNNYVSAPTSIKESLEDGVQDEAETIAMYNRFLTQNLPSNVKDVFTRIRDTSKNHLQAFQNALEP